ncbi:MAG: 6,7-dimethyl-8-ribityllumazine synthase [Planctomycetota bacterium]|nr:6,7-dimethyl-8-ribityllumazine synthase [Planctomycetota bacterium]
MALDPQSTQRTRASRPGSKIGIVVSRFHDELTGAMKNSAVRELVASGVLEHDIHIVWVPGSFELPIVASQLASKLLLESVLCFGLILKGETEHDHWVAHGTTSGIMRASLTLEIPIHFGVLTCATLEQARARALPPELGGREDKGREVARAAIETLLALDEIGEMSA